mgnify:CR=1 FL=1
MARDHTIKRYRKNDMQLFQSIARYGHATLSDFQDLKISERRAKDFARKKCGLLETFSSKHNGKTITAYRLTRKGTRFVQNRLDIEHPSRSNELTFTHNQKLKSVIQELEESGEKKIKRYYTENELKHGNKKLLSELKTFSNIGVTDCMLVFEDNSKVCVEITTCNYTRQIIEGKANFAAALKVPILFYQAY